MIGPAGIAHLLLFGILIPISAIRAQKIIESRPLPPRRRYFVSVVVQLAVLAFISIAVAWRELIPLFILSIPPARAIVAGCVMLVIAVSFGWTRWKKAVRERKRVVALFMPTNASERVFWIVSAALAGFGEEVTWRGVQTALLMRLTNNLIIAAAICVVMFSIAHAIQGWKSVGVIAVFAAAFHVLVWLAGSLYVAMAVHFIYDLIAGFAYGYLGRKLGYPIDTGFGSPDSGFVEPITTDPA
ncbi:MAG TPA: CPBP family intramembrane glutamic endopeptidase [Thermoanaerobaculia bacterium]|nr:CPBP family intramembrane glutamic endopeptidase [Thermoanaerobaculia bacterium]